MMSCAQAKIEMLDTKHGLPLEYLRAIRGVRIRVDLLPVSCQGLSETMPQRRSFTIDDDQTSDGREGYGAPLEDAVDVELGFDSVFGDDLDH